MYYRRELHLCWFLLEGWFIKGNRGADLEVEPALRLPRRGSPVHRAAAVHLFRSPAARGQGTARSREDR